MDITPKTSPMTESKHIPLVKSFSFIAKPNAKVLILGSMPGIKSLEEEQYYAHPRNAFWPIMLHLLSPSDINTSDNKAILNYEKRLQVLLQHRIALWDVLAECEREGSLDSAIINKSIFLNDFPSLLSYAPEIQTILFNGKAASQLFRRHALKKNETVFANIKLIDLPSTSPANARMGFEAKLAAWSILKKTIK